MSLSYAHWIMQYYLSVFLAEWLEDESSLGVVEDSEGFISLFDSDDVHETSWETSVSSDLAVNENVLFLVVEDKGNISAVNSVVESLPVHKKIQVYWINNLLASKSSQNIFQSTIKSFFNFFLFPLANKLN